MVFYRTFEHGIGPAWQAVTTPDALHAFWLTLLMVAIAVPLNTVFGVRLRALLVARTASAARRCSTRSSTCRSPSRPVVVGLALILVYGQHRLVRRLAGGRTGSR